MLRRDFGELASAIASLAPTLTNLNVRGTGFDDECATALANAGAKIARLNASCSELSVQGLKAISDASPQLLVLDLCYCSRICQDAAGIQEVVLVVRRHTEMVRRNTGLEMLGLGGFEHLGLGRLTEMLCHNGASMNHLGIGGCTALDGAATLAALPELVPNLTALNAHKLNFKNGSVRTSIVNLLMNFPKLVSLDVHWGDLGDAGDLFPIAEQVAGHVLLTLAERNEGDNAHADFEEIRKAVEERWLRLGAEHVGERFHEPTVLQHGARAVDCSRPRLVGKGTRRADKHDPVPLEPDDMVVT